jgi:hypothetical protein
VFNTIKPWVGAKPQPDPPHTPYNINLNGLSPTFITSNTRWRNGHRTLLNRLDGGGGPRFKSGRAITNFTHNPFNQIMSDTWHPRIGPRVLISFAHKRTRVTSNLTAINQQMLATCQLSISPRQLATCQPSYGSVTSPRHPTRRMLTSSCAMCHPSSGDTCHLRIGPTVRPKSQICLTRVITWSHHVSYTDLPCVLYGPATCPVQTVRTGTVSIKFLPVWLGEQIAISSPYGLHLRK